MVAGLVLSVLWVRTGLRRVGGRGPRPSSAGRLGVSGAWRVPGWPAARLPRPGRPPRARGRGAVRSGTACRRSPRRRRRWPRRPRTRWCSRGSATSRSGLVGVLTGPTARPERGSTDAAGIRQKGVGWQLILLLAGNNRLVAVRPAPACRWAASVCAGAMLPEAAGLTSGRPATIHHDAVGELRATGVQFIDGARIVDDGDLLTAAGVTVPR